MNSLSDQDRTNEPLVNDRFIQRFCNRDVTLWAESEVDKEEVDHRLDWLDAAHFGNDTIQHAESLLDGLLSEGFSHAVVLGMGGSSLAPEVFSEIFLNFKSFRKSGLDLSILDTTDPEQIQAKRVRAAD